MTVKKFQSTIICTLALLATLTLFSFHPYSVSDKAANGFAIVELFTSEGCSSCPAADALAATISAENNKDVYFLSFHVDYWNQYGWKDIFSSNNYTLRQQEYAGFFKLNSIYTPQVIVNGRAEFVGSNESKLRSAIQQELKISPLSTIDLTVSNDARTVSVNSMVSNAPNSILNLALVQRTAEVAVKKGENAGKTLRHTDIVRSYKKLAILKDRANAATLFIPEGVALKDLKVIAYVQNRERYNVTGVAIKNLQ